jgi:hypothetical protein
MINKSKSKMKEEVQSYIQELLQILHLRIPSEPAKHNFTLSDQGQLTLSVFIDNVWRDFYFDDEYVDVPADELALVIIKGLEGAGHKITDDGKHGAKLMMSRALAAQEPDIFAFLEESFVSVKEIGKPTDRQITYWVEDPSIPKGTGTIDMTFVYIKYPYDVPEGAIVLGKKYKEQFIAYWFPCA